MEAAAFQVERTLQQELSLPIILAERVIKSAQEAESSKNECSELARQTNRLSQLLRSTVRLASSTQSLYERPIRRIVADVSKNLDKALTLVRKYKKHGAGVLRQVFAITTTADFRKVSTLLENSIGDLTWILSVFESDGTNIALPPIASNDPILAWVWSYLATVQMGQLKDRVDAASELASLADSERTKKMIVDEGGIHPLLKMLKEGGSPEAQIAAANALISLATDPQRVRMIVDDFGIRTIVQVLNDSPMRVQAAVANLVAKMTEFNAAAQEEFPRENVVKPLMNLLSMDTVLDDPTIQTGRTSIHSLVQINKELASGKHLNSHIGANSLYSDGSSRGGHHRKEKEVETPETKLALKVSCAGALWKLSRGSLANSKKITESKGLLCLVKIIEVETGELQYNCLMTVTEIAAVAESNTDLRRVAFKPNSPFAKAVLDQLLRILQEESNVDILIPAIKSIGSLARTFPAKESRIIKTLVCHLADGDMDVAIEAAVALGKFACPENFNCVEHAKAIIEFNGVPPLLKLLKTNDRAQLHGLVLLCYLSLHVGNSKVLEQARVLNAVESMARSVASQHPELKDLFAKTGYESDACEECFSLYRTVVFS
ncbi:uncharacterized protein LOC115741594 [Rhodamnia argentea]|uniref:Uncharacterized protein LOC115741594 n=1 Tax=Rhodamnia argentea TaxID=178133 RepID=A0A8B8P9T7_9MYRT|nr:uncharacterized protein LOC115741594 [Rhodamnia argentea]